MKEDDDEDRFCHGCALVTTPDERPVFSFVSCALDQAAERTGLSKSTIQQAIRDGDLIAHYSGTKPIVRAVDLDAWVASLPTTPPRRPRRA